MLMEPERIMRYRPVFHAIRGFFKILSSSARHVDRAQLGLRHRHVGAFQGHRPGDEGGAIHNEPDVVVQVHDRHGPAPDLLPYISTQKYGEIRVS